MSIGIMALLIIFGIVLLSVIHSAYIYWLYTVGPKTARLYANLSLPQFVCAPGMPGIPDDFAAWWDVQNFLDATGRSPFEPDRPGDVLDLYDVDGWRLFRDVTLQLPNGRELRARMAATTVLSDPLFSMGIDDQPLRIREQLIPRAEQVARQRNLTRVKGDPAIVCYAYPALGLLCSDVKGKRWVIDLTDNTISEVKPAKQRIASSRGARGHAPWSPFDHSTSESLRYSVNGFMRYWTASSKLRKSKARLSQPPPFDGRILHLRLIAQQSDNFCAFASAEMILSHVGINETQREIAKAMNFDGVDSLPKDQVIGYKKLTNGHFEIELDDKPTFADVQRHIDAGRPLKNGIRDHARVTVGWSVKPGAGPEGLFIYVHDPLPMGTGSRYFERWGSVRIVDHIYVVEAART